MLFTEESDRAVCVKAGARSDSSVFLALYKKSLLRSCIILLLSLTAKAFFDKGS